MGKIQMDVKVVLLDIGRSNLPHRKVLNANGSGSLISRGVSYEKLISVLCCRRNSLSNLLRQRCVGKLKLSLFACALVTILIFTSPHG